jgi:hypothetical protein
VLSWMRQQHSPIEKMFYVDGLAGPFIDRRPGDFSDRFQVLSWQKVCRRDCSSPFHDIFYGLQLWNCL